MRRGILGVVGGTITGVQRLRCTRKPIRIEPDIRVIRNRVLGKTILDVDRIGKRVVFCIGNQTASEFLVLEPRMTGLVLVAAPPSPEHLRFQMSLQQCDVDQVQYWDRRGLGSITLLSTDQLAEKFSRQHIGPDALQVSFEEFHAIFSPLKREIKVALLDQKRIAGVGNLYASELLHTARIHPARLCHQLRKADYRRIYDQMRIVLETAIRYEGSTLADGTYRNALNQSGGYQNRHRVYARAGQRCQQCERGQIKRVVQAQRATFFCPSCQRQRKR